MDFFEYTNRIIDLAKIRYPLFALFLLSSQISSAQFFEAEGSDLLMGVGPSQIAKGGAVVASVNDIYSIYWNPAGLSDINSTQIAVAGQLNRPLAHLSFAGAAFALPYLKALGFKATAGVAFIPRVYFKADGTFKSNELKTSFLRTALPGMSGGFTGKIDSETNDYRIGLGGYFEKLPSLKFGASLGRVKCHTLFSGYRSDPADPIDMNVHADAWAADVGIIYKLNDNLSFGAVLKHINGELDVKTVTKHKYSSNKRHFKAKFIKDLNIGVNYRLSEKWEFGLGYEMMYGKYSMNQFDFQLIRFYGAYHSGHYSYHLGLIAPLKIKTDTIKEFKLPFPVMPTVGVDYSTGNLTIGSAFYVHPVMTFATKQIQAAVDLSVKYSF